MSPEELGRMDLHIMGRPGAGKTGLIWAIGQHFVGGGDVGGGLSASSFGVDFREHWEDLEGRRQRSGGWRATGYRSDDQKELDLFSVSSKRSRRPKELSLYTRDLPGAAWVKVVNCWREGGEIAEVDERVDDPEHRLEEPETILLVIHGGTLGEDSQDAGLSMFVCNALVDCRSGDYPKERVSVAVVLTACDAVELRDELGDPWLERLIHAEPERRSRAVKELLISKIQGFSHAIEGLEPEDLRFFAVSAWGAGGDMHHARPWHVEEPILWLIDRAWSMRTKWVRARRSRKLSLVGAALCLLIAASTGVLLGPTVHQLQSGGGEHASADPFVRLGEILSLPSRHIPSLSQTPKHLEAVHLRALALASEEDLEGAQGALAWLEESDPSRYWSSRTAAEILRRRAQEGGSQSDRIRELETGASGGGSWGAFLDPFTKTELLSLAIELRLRATDRDWGELQSSVIEPLSGGEELLVAVHGERLGALLLESWEADVQSGRIGEQMDVAGQIVLAEGITGVLPLGRRAGVELAATEGLVRQVLRAFMNRDFSLARTLYAQSGEIGEAAQVLMTQRLRGDLQKNKSGGVPEWFAEACLVEVELLGPLLLRELACDAISRRDEERLWRLESVAEGRAVDWERGGGEAPYEMADLRLIFRGSRELDLHRELDRHWGSYEEELAQPSSPDGRIGLLHRHWWVMSRIDPEELRPSDLEAVKRSWGAQVLTAIEEVVGGNKLDASAQFEELLEVSLERDRDLTTGAIVISGGRGGMFPNLASVAKVFSRRPDVHELMQAPHLRRLAAFMIEKLPAWSEARGEFRDSLRLMTALAPLVMVEGVAADWDTVLERGEVSLKELLSELQEGEEDKAGDVDLVRDWGLAVVSAKTRDSGACRFLAREGFVCLSGDHHERALGIFDGARSFDPDSALSVFHEELRRGEPAPGAGALDRVVARKAVCEVLNEALELPRGEGGAAVRETLRETWLVAKREILVEATGLPDRVEGETLDLEVRVRAWKVIDEWSSGGEAGSSPEQLEELFIENRLWLAAQEALEGRGEACIGYLRQVRLSDGGKLKAYELQRRTDELSLVSAGAGWVKVCLVAMKHRKESFEAFSDRPLWHLGVHALLRSLKENPLSLSDLAGVLRNLSRGEVAAHPTWAAKVGGRALLQEGLETVAAAQGEEWSDPDHHEKLRVILMHLKAFDPGLEWRVDAWEALRPGIEGVLSRSDLSRSARDTIKSSLSEFGAGGSELATQGALLSWILAELKADAPEIAKLRAESLQGGSGKDEVLSFLERVIEHEMRLVDPGRGASPFMAMRDEVSEKAYQRFYEGLASKYEEGKESPGWKKEKGTLGLPEKRIRKGSERERRPALDPLLLSELKEERNAQFETNEEGGDPVHSVSYLGAYAYAATEGLSLPRIEQYRAMFEGRKFPWGDEWEPGHAVTKENVGLFFDEKKKLYRFRPVAGEGRDRESRFANLIGNVREYVLIAPDPAAYKKDSYKAWKDLVPRVFGPTAWEFGKEFDIQDGGASLTVEALWKPSRLTGFRCVCELPVDLLKMSQP